MVLSPEVEARVTSMEQAGSVRGWIGIRRWASLGLALGILSLACAGNVGAEEPSAGVATLVAALIDQGDSPEPATVEALATRLEALVAAGVPAKDHPSWESVRKAATVPIFAIQSPLWRLADASGDKGLVRVAERALKQALKRADHPLLKEIAADDSPATVTRSMLVLGQWKVLHKRLDDGAAQVLARAASTALACESAQPQHRAVHAMYWKALATALQKCHLDLLGRVATGLAGQACTRAREVLSDALRRLRKVQVSDRVAIVQALGRCGDVDAVPLLLTFVPGTQPPVMLATLRALWELKPEVKRVHVRAILDVTLTDFLTEINKAYMFPGKSPADLLSVERRNAYMTVEVQTSMDLGDLELHGFHSFFLSFIDATPELAAIDAPIPPRNGFHSPRGYPTVITTKDWLTWWKIARKRYKGS